MEKDLFLSHAAIDKQLAEKLAIEIETRGTYRVFLAARPGDIAPGREWQSEIKRRLREADAYVVLLTPASTERPWVSFETGAAWMTDRLLLPILAAGLSREEVPDPIKSFQLYSIDDPTELEAVFRELDSDATSLEALIDEIRDLGVEAAEAALAANGWKYVKLGTSCYAWAGPLATLPDLSPDLEPAGLAAALSAKGMKTVGVHENAMHNPAYRQALQVFETDFKTYRRRIKRGSDAFLLATPF